MSGAGTVQTPSPQPSHAAQAPRHILVTAHGLRLPMLAASTCDAIIRAQQLYPERHGFSARVIRPSAAKAAV